MDGQRYSNVAIGMHWLLAVMILSALTLGLYMTDLPTSPRKIQLITYHKWLGICILTVAVLRLLWRLTHRPPELPQHMPRWEIFAALATHRLFYVLMIAVPIVGWVMSSAKGRPVVMFGLWQLPDMVEKNKELGELLAETHELLAQTLLILIVLHVLAALKHQFINRDGVLRRMWPRSGGH